MGRFCDGKNRTRDSMMEVTGQQRFCDGSNRTRDSVMEATGQQIL